MLELFEVADLILSYLSEALISKLISVDCPSAEPILQLTFELRTALAEFVALRDQFFKGQIGESSFDSQVLKVVEQFVN
jgi:hypothetical protein